MPPIPTYRERLRLEGLALAGLGLLDCALLLRVFPQARRWPLNTAGQLVLVAALLGYFGPRSVRKALDASVPLPADELGSGEPTPLWHIPPIVAGLTLAFGLAPNELAGWDAGVRIGGGCALVGLAQAGLLERVVARDEALRGRRYYRVRGSRLGRGTKLGYRPHIAEAPTALAGTQPGA